LTWRAAGCKRETATGWTPSACFGAGWEFPFATHIIEGDLFSDSQDPLIHLQPMKKTAPPKIKKFPAAKQRLLDQLLDKNSEGTITSGERAKLEQLVDQAEHLMVSNAKRLARFVQIRREGKPTRAVPVTVWVHPNSVER
jgi:hypothetical protein